VAGATNQNDDCDDESYHGKKREERMSGSPGVKSLSYSQVERSVSTEIVACEAFSPNFAAV
jgi:hypothetical protein